MSYRQVPASDVRVGDKIDTNWSDGWDDNYWFHGKVVSVSLAEGFEYGQLLIEFCDEEDCDSPQGGHGGVVFRPDELVRVDR